MLAGGKMRCPCSSGKLGYKHIEITPMVRAVKDIEKELLTLPHKERARLAHALLISLDVDEKGDRNIEAAWLEEVQRREQQIVAGVKPAGFPAKT